MPSKPLPYEATFTRWDSEKECEYVLSTIEFKAGNHTHASKICDRHRDGMNADHIELYRVGTFYDDDGEPRGSEVVGSWDDGLGEWEWAEAA